MKQPTNTTKTDEHEIKKWKRKQKNEAGSNHTHKKKKNENKERKNDGGERRWFGRSTTFTFYILKKDSLDVPGGGNAEFLERGQRENVIEREVLFGVICVFVSYKRTYYWLNPWICENHPTVVLISQLYVIVNLSLDFFATLHFSNWN